MPPASHPGSAGDPLAPSRAGAPGRACPVFVNTAAGASARSTHLPLVELFRRHQFAVQFHSLPPTELAAAIAAAARTRPPAIVVGGGDGTLNTAAGVLAGTAIPLGILPFGTLNHFARDAGVPLDLDAAVANIVRLHTRSADVAVADGRVILNNCSIGGYSEALRRREALRQRAGHGKWRAMLLAAVAVLRHVPRVHVALESEQWNARLRASFVLIANNRYADDVILSGRRVRLDEGSLWIYGSRAHRWRDLGRAALQAWRVGIHQATELLCWSTPRLTLKTRMTPLPVAIDGEVAQLTTPVVVRSWPRALRVIVPAPEGSSEAS